MNKEQLVLTGLAFAISAIYLLWMCIKHAPTLRSEDGEHEDAPARASGGITVTSGASSTGTHSPLAVGAPPDTYKRHRLLIVRCSDPMMWYANLIGKEVPYLGTWPTEGCHKSREPAGFVNVVKTTDARIVVKEEKVK